MQEETHHPNARDICALSQKPLHSLLPISRVGHIETKALQELPEEDTVDLRPVTVGQQRSLFTYCFIGTNEKPPPTAHLHIVHHQSPQLCRRPHPSQATRLRSACP